MSDINNEVNILFIKKYELWKQKKTVLAHGKKPFLPAPHGSILNKKLPPTPGVEPSLPQLPAVPQLPPHPNGNLRNQAIGNEKVRSFINSTVPRTPPLKNVDHNSGSGEILPPPPPTVFDPVNNF